MIRKLFLTLLLLCLPFSVVYGAWKFNPYTGKLDYYESVSPWTSDINGSSFNLTTTGNVTADFFIGNGSQLTGLAGGGTPGGNDTEIQYNDGGAFGGIPNVAGYLKNDGAGAYSYDNPTGSGNVTAEGLAATQVAYGSSTTGIKGSTGLIYDDTLNLTTAFNFTVTGTLTVPNDSIALGTKTTGNYVASLGTTLPLTGGAAGSEGAALNITIPKATTSADGYLNATDWTTFNGKVATTRLIGTTLPLTGGGDLSGDRNLSINILKDLVTTPPLTGGVNDIFPGADSDVTIAFDNDAYKHALHFTITNGTSDLATGWYCCARAINNWTAGGWEVLGDAAGSTTVAVKKFDPGAGGQNVTEANFTLCSGTENITLTMQSFNEDTSLGSFNTTIVKGEWYGFNVTTAGHKWVNIVIYE